MTVELSYDADPEFEPPPEDPSFVRLDESNTARIARIVGEEGLKVLANTRVCVLGLGGVGSSCVEALARGGIGSFVLVDQDVVQASNINRQAIAFMSTVGKPKIEVMAGMIEDINPDANVWGYRYFLSARNIGTFMDEHLHDVDYVIDAIDSVSTKLALAKYFNDLEEIEDKASYRSLSSTGGLQPEDLPSSPSHDAGSSSENLPRDMNSPVSDRRPLLISAMGGGNKLDPLSFAFSDLYDTTNDPIARTMRKEGRKIGIRHLLVLSSSERPVKTAGNPEAARQQRSGLGTMSYIPPIMGQMLAGYVLRDVLKNEFPDDGQAHDR